MDLVGDVTGRVGLERDRVEAALGSLLLVMRLGTDAHTWDMFKAAVPDASRLLALGTMTTGGRSGEIIGITRPGAVRRSLETNAFSAHEVDEVAQALRDAVQARLVGDPAARLLLALDRALR